MSWRDIQANEDRIQFPSLRTFLDSDPKSLPSGDYEIQHGLPIHVRWVNTGANVTFVSFAAAIGRGVSSVPVFSGQRVSADLGTNVLLLSDPTLLLDDQLMVGWYLGNRHQPNLQRQISNIIAAFQGDGRVALFGASGGGFAALYQNMRLKRATTFLANPTVNVAIRPFLTKYLSAAWGVNSLDATPQHIVTDLREVYSNRVGNQVIYLQNSFDETFVQGQFWPFLHSSNPESRIYYLTPHLGPGHVAPDWPSMRRIVSALVETDDWDQLKAIFASMPLSSKRSPSQQKITSVTDQVHLSR